MCLQSWLEDGHKCSMSPIAFVYVSNKQKFNSYSCRLCIWFKKKLSKKLYCLFVTHHVQHSASMEQHCTRACSKTGRSENKGDKASKRKRRRKRHETVDCKKVITDESLVGMRVWVAWPCEKEVNAGFAVRETSQQVDERAFSGSFICSSVYETVDRVPPVSLRLPHLGDSALMEQQNWQIISDNPRENNGKSRKRKEFETNHSEMDLRPSLAAKGIMQPTKKKPQVYPLKSLNFDYSSKTPRVYPLKIDWTSTSSKTGKNEHDADETRKKKIEKRHRRRKRRVTPDCGKQEKLSTVRDTPYEVDERSTLTSSCFICDSVFEAAERVTPDTLLSICDGKLEATSRCNLSCTAYVCFCERTQCMQIV